jgi:hypothetical protein
MNEFELGDRVTRNGRLFLQGTVRAVRVWEGGGHTMRFHLIDWDNGCCSAQLGSELQMVQDAVTREETVLRQTWAYLLESITEQDADLDLGLLPEPVDADVSDWVDAVLQWAVSDAPSRALPSVF